MGIATAAGALYAPIVFLIGLIFGTIPVLILAPTTRRQRGGRSRNTHDVCRERVCLPLLRGSASCAAHGSCPIHNGRGGFRGVDVRGSRSGRARIRCDLLDLFRKAPLL